MLFNAIFQLNYFKSTYNEQNNIFIFDNSLLDRQFSSVYGLQSA